MSTITMTRSQYEAIMSVALRHEYESIIHIRREVDAANDVARYVLSIRWKNTGGTKPPRIELGLGWPTDQSFLLELDRPIERNDVDQVLETQASSPLDVMVTPDPFSTVGWTLVDDYTFR